MKKTRSNTQLLELVTRIHVARLQPDDFLETRPGGVDLSLLDRAKTLLVESNCFRRVGLLSHGTGTESQ
jgi:hypothetical protein